MEAVVLAGGLGTRLRPEVRDLPKPMAPIDGKPFLSRVLSWLCRQEVTRCVLAVGYKCESIMDYYGARFQNMEILYSIEEEPLGTGGAIKKALERCCEHTVLAANGDTYFPVDVKAMQACHKLPCTISCLFREDASRYGLVLTKGEKVTGFQEKREGASGRINGGVYLLDRCIFERFHGKFSLETDVLPLLVEEGKVDVYGSNAFFIDIGIPEDYRRAQRSQELSLTEGLERNE